MSQTVTGTSVAVVTINWNGWRDTLRCLTALRNTDGVDWHLIIVDNGSTDGSLQHLRGLGSDVTLIETGVNGGWTGGNNVGVRSAMQRGYPYFFLLNNDAFVRPDTLKSLLAASGVSGAAGRRPVLGPVHRGLTSADFDFSLAVADPKTGVPEWKTNREDSVEQQVVSTAYIPGAALFAHRDHFDRIGFFDDRFFLNFDDTDWCFRAKVKGCDTLIVKRAMIDHVGSASIGGQSSPLQTYFMTRNRLLFAEKHCTVPQRLSLLRWNVWQARQLLKDRGSDGAWARLTESKGTMMAFRHGIRDYAFRRFGDCGDEIRIA